MITKHSFLCIFVFISPFFYLLSCPSHRLNGGPLKAEPEYEKNLSEETAKLQRLYGGGDLSSFPEFTFTGEREREVQPQSSYDFKHDIVYRAVSAAGSLSFASKIFQKIPL